MKKLHIISVLIILLYGFKKEIVSKIVSDTNIKQTTLIKQFISPDAWKNNVQVNDWSKQNGDKIIWFDMDLDGQPDKLDFVTSDGNSFFLKIFKYNGSNYVSTIDVTSIVRNNALQKFITDSMYVGNIP